MDDRHLLPDNIVSVHRVKLPKNQQEMLERSMLDAQRNAKDFNARQQIPATLVEHMTDPRAAQLQMMFASLDERGKKTLMAMAAAMVKLHKDG